MRSTLLQVDLNPILDQGAPKSVGGIHTAAKLSDALEIPFTLEPPRSQYMQGFGSNCADAKPIIGSWSLPIQDIYGKRTHLSFDLVQGDNPLLIGLDTLFGTFHHRINSDSPPFTVRLSKPDDDYVRVFHIYYAEDENKNLRCRLQLIVHPSTSVTTFFSLTSHPRTTSSQKRSTASHTLTLTKLSNC